VQFADGSTTRWAARHVMEPELHLEGRSNDRNQPHRQFAGRLMRPASPNGSRPDQAPRLSAPRCRGKLDSRAA
jgi:hypothetical protein